MRSPESSPVTAIALRPPRAWLSLLGPLVLAVLVAACGGDDQGGDCPNCPGLPGEAPGALFYEPVEYCLAGAATGDSLHVYNLGDTTLVWTPVHVPEGATGFPGQLELPAQTVSVSRWSWDPAGPYPVLDSLVAETNDPRRERVVILVRRQDPTQPGPFPPAPHPPIPGAPDDGAVFVYPDTVANLAWSRLASCNGNASYTLQVSNQPGFPPGGGTRSLRVNDGPQAQIIFDPRGLDRGLVLYWRVSASDGVFASGWSETRSLEHR